MLYVDSTEFIEIVKPDHTDIVIPFERKFIFNSNFSFWLFFCHSSSYCIDCFVQR